MVDQKEKNITIAKLLINTAMELLDNKADVIIYQSKYDSDIVSDECGFLQYIPTGVERIYLDLYHNKK